MAVKFDPILGELRESDVYSGETVGSIGGVIDGSTASVPDTTDKVPFTEGGVVKHITWANLKAMLDAPRIYTTASSASLTLNYATYDYYELTAQAEPLVFADPTTTSYTGGERFIVSVTCDGTARAITFPGTKFVFRGGIAQPTTLVASKRTTFGFIYDKATDKMNLIGLAQEA